MWVKAMTLQNFRSFETAKVHFARNINVLVGPNNSGKSSILLPLLSLQAGLPTVSASDRRIGASASAGSQIAIQFEEQDHAYFHGNPASIEFAWSVQNENYLLRSVDGGGAPPLALGRIPDTEPNNYIYPFLSKRKVGELQEQVVTQIVRSVHRTFQNLNAKIDRLSSPGFQPAHDVYTQACERILGFLVTAADTNGGKQAVYGVHNDQHIPLLSMGEGVMNVLGLVVHLAIAEGKLFLIEEPENDVHPRALKALLDLVIERSRTNQFIITTHSNIVLKKLGAVPDSKIFRVDCEFPDRLPTSTVTEVPNTTAERRQILEELGYEPGDSELWAAWLFLEESSAEKIVREYLIPWFVPRLQGRLRTYSAHSLSEVGPKFQDFNDLLVFLHLEPAYKDRVWVLIDGGEKEAKIIGELQTRYAQSGWNRDRFQQLQKHDFEDYYPVQFQDDVAAIKATSGKQQRRTAKKELLARVEEWIVQDRNRAKEAFATLVSEFIALLRSIETAIDHRDA